MIILIIKDIFPNFYKNKSIKDFKLEFGIFNLKIYIKF